MGKDSPTKAISLAQAVWAHCLWERHGSKHKGHFYMAKQDTLHGTAFPNCAVPGDLERD